MPSDTKRTGEKILPFPKRFKEELTLFFLFHEVFSEPACRRMHPLFRLSLRKVLRGK